MQWRELRTIGDKIKGLKAELPAKDAEGNRPSSPLDGEIKQMESVRALPSCAAAAFDFYRLTLSTRTGLCTGALTSALRVPRRCRE